MRRDFWVSLGGFLAVRFRELEALLLAVPAVKVPLQTASTAAPEKNSAYWYCKIREVNAFIRPIVLSCSSGISSCENSCWANSAGAQAFLPFHECSALSSPYSRSGDCRGSHLISTHSIRLCASLILQPFHGFSSHWQGQIPCEPSATPPKAVSLGGGRAAMWYYFRKTLDWFLLTQRQKAVE